jgi:hypothetical protein
MCERGGAAQGPQGPSFGGFKTSPHTQAEPLAQPNAAKQPTAPPPPSLSQRTRAQQEQTKRHHPTPPPTPPPPSSQAFEPAAHQPGRRSRTKRLELKLVAVRGRRFGGLVGHHKLIFLEFRITHNGGGALSGLLKSCNGVCESR